MATESHEPKTPVEEPAPSEGDGPDSESTAVCRRACPEQGRRDGWTPFARRLFLEVLAETGRITRACEYARLSKQSAYALRARDPLFAAGWDAACELARAPLADALYEQAVEGVTDTITRNGEIVAERHRFDSRLSIAVLHRLDKRCDRAALFGSRHLALVGHWDEWLSLVGKGEDEAARALLDSAPHGQFGQLPEGAKLTAEPEEDPGLDLSDRCWKDEIEGEWMTDFPPPADFAGYESRPYDEDDEDERYQRACTPEEAALLDASDAAAGAEDRAEEEQLRDALFAQLKGGLPGASADRADQTSG